MRVNIGEYGIKHMYASYVKNTVEPLSYKQYKQVVEEYVAGMMELVVEEAHNFKLPYSLGKFRIKKTKINLAVENPKLAIDWGTTRKVGVKVFHLNDHSDGYKMKFHWEKKSAITKANTKRPYSFVLARDVKRKLAQVFQQPQAHTLYPEEITN